MYVHPLHSNIKNSTRNQFCHKDNSVALCYALRPRSKLILDLGFAVLTIDIDIAIDLVLFIFDFHALL